MSLTDEYNRRCREWSDIHEHLPTLLEHVLAAGKDARILELGTRTGNSTAAFLHGLQVKGSGLLMSVDLDVAQVPDDWWDIDRWTFLRGSDQDPLIISAIQSEAPYDILFIDTSHTYEHTLFELECYAPLVRPGGVVLLHDTEVMNDACDVKRALDEYTTERGLTWTNDPRCFGLGTLRIPQ